MTRRLRLAAIAPLLALLLTGGPAAAQTAPPSVRPGAPGEPSRPADEAPDTAAPRYTEADVAFMQGMIHHHAQALDMTALVPERSASPAVRMLAHRIEVSQTDEINWMRRWLLDRHQEAPEPGAMAHHHDAGHAMLMPGMLSPDEMAQLAAASGPAFDRLFLQYMIRHHQGALIMVADLLASEGGAQAPSVFLYATDVDADQRADIDRMMALLDGPPLPPPTRAQG